MSWGGSKPNGDGESSKAKRSHIDEGTYASVVIVLLCSVSILPIGDDDTIWGICAYILDTKIVGSKHPLPGIIVISFSFRRLLKKPLAPRATPINPLRSLL